jgi:nucleoporin SEH1
VGAHKGKEEECHLSWNPSSFDPPTLAVGTSDGHLKIWQYQENFRKWQSFDISDNSSQHSKAIHDVAWAANLGRSYHLIATASEG